MSYTARPAAGSRIAININGVLTNINGVEGISPFGSAKAFIDTTPLEATQAKTFVGDIPDPGELAFTLFLDPHEATHVYLQAAANTPGQVNQFVVTPSNTANTFTLNAEVGTFQPSFQKGKGQMADVKAKISGAIVQA